MLNRLSISVLLKSVIAVMGVVIVVMLALSARESWNRLQTANRISQVANISACMFTAMNGVRVDRAGTARDMLTDKHGISPLIKQMRDAEIPAFTALLPLLGAADFPDRDQAVADLDGKIKQLIALQQQTEAAMLQP